MKNKDDKRIIRINKYRDMLPLAINFKVSVDDRGRIILPVDLKRIYQITNRSSVYLYPTTDGILISVKDKFL